MNCKHTQKLAVFGAAQGGVPEKAYYLFNRV